MGAQFQTKDVGWSLMDTETVTITRNVASSGYPVTYSMITVYTGAADFQDSPQGIVYNPSGAVDSATGVVVIDPDSSGNFPDVHTDDILSAKGTKYVVLESSIWYMAPSHLEITVKRGPLPYEKA